MAARRGKQSGRAWPNGWSEPTTVCCQDAFVPSPSLARCRAGRESLEINANMVSVRALRASPIWQRPLLGTDKHLPCRGGGLWTVDCGWQTVDGAHGAQDAHYPSKVSSTLCYGAQLKKRHPVISTIRNGSRVSPSVLCSTFPSFVSARARNVLETFGGQCTRCTARRHSPVGFLVGRRHVSLHLCSAAQSQRSHLLRSMSRSLASLEQAERSIS